MCITRRAWVYVLVASLICFGTKIHAADVNIDGQAYRPLTDIAAQYGMTLSWPVAARSAELQNKYCILDFTAGERLLRLNNEPMALGFPVMLKQGMLYITQSDFDKNIFPLLSPGQIPGPVPALHRIVIDPGHGGNDPGTEVFPPGARAGAKAIDNEKTHTLEVAFLVADELRKRGYEVILARTTDVNVDKAERAAMANRVKADLYLSIHFNHADQDYVTGTETMILTPFGQASTSMDESKITKEIHAGNRLDAWNAIAGFSVERAVTRALGTANRGVKRENLIVLDELDMPGILVECGFLSNPAERAKIDTAAYRQQIAMALADGVDLYKATLDQLRPPQSTPPTKSTAPAAANSGKK
ncbi:MAG TPA: N-acetylmuramoyl-L-alanine amidase [Opitutales bacterium]|nr:N-acetylmuramoyl-L-alanine amidase [Opitutales bacterium]